MIIIVKYRAFIENNNSFYMDIESHGEINPYPRTLERVKEILNEEKITLKIIGSYEVFA